MKREKTYHQLLKENRGMVMGLGIKMRKILFK